MTERHEYQGRINDRGVLGCRRIGFGPDDEPFDDEKHDPAKDEDGEDVDGEREEIGESALAEEKKIREKSLERMVDRHRVERQGAIKNTNVHETREQPLVFQRTALEDDPAQGLDDAFRYMIKPVFGPAGADDSLTAVKRCQEKSGRRQDDQEENDFFRNRKHRDPSISSLRILARVFSNHSPLKSRRGR
ncbi:MAG: hypothetical protein ABSF88_05745 [Candidatus Aminicenantales bacterium]